MFALKTILVSAVAVNAIRLQEPPETKVLNRLRDDMNPAVDQPLKVHINLYSLENQHVWKLDVI